MVTVALPDEVVDLGRDLRTVVALLAGVRLSESACAELVAEVFEGASSRRHEAAVYLLAAHLLALDERPSLDNLAWRWLNARGGRSWTVRQAADAVRLGIFAVESGWADVLVRRLVTLVTQSRSTPLWVDLTDLARRGGRHAHVLRPLVFRADLWERHDPARAAALLALSSAHELHRLTPAVGEGFAALAHGGRDVRCVTLFTGGGEPSAEAMRAVHRLVSDVGLLHGVHACPAGVRRLHGLGDPRVVALPSHSDEFLAQASRPWTASQEAGANLPSMLVLPPERVLSVFPSGARLAAEARWWASGSERRQAR